MPKALTLILACIWLSTGANAQVSPIDQEDTIVVRSVLKLSLEEAERLSQLPLNCVHEEYPNKLNQVIDDSSDLRSPSDLHPAFYGCFDWHSSVHGHWSLVRLIRLYPEISSADSIRSVLSASITEENIVGEIEYFEDPVNKGFERIYGWAWLYKLAEELHLWEDDLGRELEETLQPLIEVIQQQLFAFLPKLNYPIRVGTHTNTAFGLSMIMDYAITLDDVELQELINSRAKDFYYDDALCPIEWEPSGYDFLSPCLEEANLMRKVLDQNSFREWFLKFLPQLTSIDFELSPGEVSDREDGHLVHLDGVNFSRAWCLYGINSALNGQFAKLDATATNHIQYSLPKIVDDNYEGGHWLASFALLSLSQE